MSESQSPMEQFNINELAGATGLILGAIGGILAIIFKSRCYCKFRIGISDKFNLCMCERKPPPDNIDLEEDEEEDPTKPKEKPKETKVSKANQKSKEKPNIQLIPEDLSTFGGLPDTTTDNLEEEDLENNANRNNP